MTAPSKLAVEIAEAISPKALDNSPTDAGDRAAIAAIIDAKIRPLVEDGARLELVRLAALEEIAYDAEPRPQHYVTTSIKRAHRILATGQPDGVLKTESVNMADQARAQRPAQEGSDKP